VNVIPRGALPDAWQSLLPGTARQLGFRPEGVRLDPAASERFTVTRRRLTGPLVRLTLTGHGLELNALVPHAAAPAIGTETGVRLDPALVFTFASDAI
jgi:iron(III) transport system ATP-binding protein